MDSITQIVLGAAVGEAVLGKKVGNKAMLWGAIAGTIPDLDVLANLFYDHLTATEMHRGFSHSILFSILFSPILGWLVSRIHRKEGVGWKGWSWLMFGSLFTHPLLDCHTNYGTTLFWPFEYKVAYNNVFIADPLYTLPFLICLILAMRLKRDNPKRKMFNRLGLIISSAYMVFTLASKGVGYYHFDKSLEKQNIAYVNMMTNATAFTSILWTATVETEDEFILGYYSLLDGSKEPEFYHFKKGHELLGDLKDEDIVKRLIKLSRGWYVVTEEEGEIYINDLRFGQLTMNEDPSMFAFGHRVWYETGELKLEQRQRSFDGIGDVFAPFFKRVAGK